MCTWNMEYGKVIHQMISEMTIKDSLKISISHKVKKKQIFKAFIGRITNSLLHYCKDNGFISSTSIFCTIS